MTTRLVLLPGLDGTGVFLGPLIEALPAWIRPVVVEFGREPPVGYDGLLPLVERAVGDEGDFFVLGWSFSGPLALMVANRFPQRTRGVILAASFVRPPLRGLAHLGPAALPPIVGVARILSRSRYVLSGRWKGRLRRDKSATWRLVSSRDLAVRVRAVIGVDARGWLRDCSSPVLYIASSDDGLVGPRNVTDVLAACPSAEVVTIAGPHLALYSNARDAAGAVSAFMAARIEAAHRTPHGADRFLIASTHSRPM